MTSSSRREQLSSRLAESALVRNVIGPKVLKPAADWYERTVEEPDTEPDPAAAPEQATNHPAEPDSARSVPEPVATESEALAAAQAAEAFFAGPDAGDPPADASADQTGGKGLVAQVIDVPVSRLTSIKDIGLRVKDRVKTHNLGVVAAGIAFWGLLAIPAVLTAVLSIYGLFADPTEVEGQIEDNLSALPEDARSIITGQLESVAGASGGGLAIGAAIGIVLALWTTSGAIAKVIATLNTIWAVEEDRSFPKLRGLALLITFGAIVFVIGAAFLLAILPPLLTEVGLADVGRWLLNAGRFPALLAFMAAGLAFLYWIGPNRDSRYRVMTWGSLVATLLWVVVSGLFTIYTSSFASYNETYGSLGAVVILLLWLFITAFMVLVGAEIDAARETRDREQSGVGARS